MSEADTTAGAIGRLRIVFIIDRLVSNLAGTENQLIKIINGLNPDDFDLHLICFQDHPWLRENRDSLRCQTHIVELGQFKRLRTYRNIIRAISLLRALRPDVVHTFFPVANIVAVLAARLAGIRHVVSSRRDYGEWMRRDYLVMTRFANRFVERIMTNSDRVKALTERVEKFDGRRIDVIYNGIDATGFQAVERDEALKQELGIPATNKVVGIVANFRPMKRHETFVRAAGAIAQKRRDVDFVLVGHDTDTRVTCRSMGILGEQLGVRSRLHFVGARRDVTRFLSIMDIGVNCSEGEGLSNAVMEYMAAGVPCVVSDSGGNPDLVKHGIHGATFKLDDYQGLCDEVLRLLDEPERRALYASNARQRLLTEMSLPAMLKAYGQYYRCVARMPEGSADSVTSESRRQPGKSRILVDRREE